jgi:hypothetical protein
MAAMFLRFYLGLVLLLGLVACSTSALPDTKTTSGQVSSPIGKIPDNNLVKGLVFDGLRLGAKGGPCEGLLELDVPGASSVCTHGPDAAPPAVDVRTEQSLTSLTAAATTASVPCIGDGNSGNRVQAVYAVSSDQLDRYPDIAPLIRGWAAQMDDVFYQSALQTGGERHVRFVTDANCNLVVNKVVLSPAADDDWATMIYEMQALGYNNPSRKYVVWMDARVYCGIAQVYPDDKPTSDNGSNGLYPMFARIDSGCWDLSRTAATHELTHVLGGVQPTAPHATNRYHCTDEYDALCYSDGSGMTMNYLCASGNEDYLDCNHDDYFHPNPPVGSYLATHWNVANSSFLQGGTTPLPNQAPVVNAGLDQSTTLPATATLRGTSTDDGLPAPTLTHQWSKVSGPGTVSFASPGSLSTTASFSVSGSYVVRLSSSDSALSASDTLTVTVAAPAPVNQTPVVNAGADLSVKVATALQLSGTASDEGLPGNSLTVSWTKTSGPGTVTFSNAASRTSTATFSVAGTYVLTLAASDGALSSSDSVTVTVTPASTTTTTFSSSLNRRTPSRSFVISAGGGTLKADLSFSSSKLKNPTLTVEVFNAVGTSLGSVRGLSSQVLQREVTAGQYTFVVTGDYVSFTLAVTHPVP